MSDQKIGLTVFLIKPDQVAALEKALTPGMGSIPLTAPLDGFFVPLAPLGAEPKWVGAVQSVIQTPIPVDMRSKSPGGLLVVKRPGGTFIVTFGHAWMKLEDSWLERDFGRRVALNAIPKDHVIEIKAEQVFAKWHLASERAPRASSVDEFGVEFDRDLVSVVEGIPALKPSLGKSVRGGTSLRLNLRNLPGNWELGIGNWEFGGGKRSYLDACGKCAKLAAVRSAAAAKKPNANAPEAAAAVGA